MPAKNGFEKYFKFIIYIIVIVLINVVGLNLYFRADLTENKIYSLSDVSKRVVSTLSEPLTIKVFFTKDLPAPYNNIEQYLQDLLNEYSLYASKYFNYRFHDVSAEEGDITPEAKENQELAKNYAIHPIQIQAVEEDEVKFLKAYMGMVLIHGDIVEQIPTITATDGLEYKLTTAIRKLNNKVSALLSLQEKIKVKLFLSSTLELVAPYMRLNNLPALPQEIETVVKDLNGINYGKLEFEYLDPSKDRTLIEQVRKYQLLNLKWPVLEDGKIPAGDGTIGLVLEYGDKATSLPLLQVINVPIIGTQYQLLSIEDLPTIINKKMETLIDINQDLGYLASHGTLNLMSLPPGMGQPQSAEAANSFRLLASQNYTVKEVDLKAETIPSGIECLVIPGPTEEFSDYDLFQIDQFLMQGKSLAIFLDSFKEMVPPQGMSMGAGRPPVYLPLQTGLEKLLAHYGIRIGAAYIMDENCYKQEVPQQYGGGRRPLYFIPQIQNQFIDKHYDFMKNIKGLFTVKISPLELVSEQIQANQIKAHRLFSSSSKSWEMRGQINLNPMFIQPPAEDQKKSFPLAYILEGEFKSYFEGKRIPEKPADKEADTVEKQNGEAEADQPATKEEEPRDLSKIQDSGAVLTKGKPAKIFLIASSEMIKDALLDEEGRDPNDMLIMNVIDYLNGHEDTALMRSKIQRFNPLIPTSVGVKTFIKGFNIGGLPALVVLFGVLVWFGRRARKKKIQTMFQS
jgi:ABC-type uncharacterized transport system involved in gliding motility auxiliary subunit